MNNFDNFCVTLLEEAKHFYEKYQSETSEEGKNAYCHSSLLLTICSLEAFVNSISEELALTNKINILDKSLLSEKEVKLEGGQFILTNQLKMFRLTDRIEYLYRRYKRKELTDKLQWWQSLKNGIELRNKLVHPKDMVEISERQLKNTLEGTIKCIDVLFRIIYKKRFPKSSHGLNSIHNY
jgi:hypothetical protein